MRRAVVVIAVLALASCGGATKPPSGAVERAKERFAELRARGIDMSRGPCLGVVAPGWVADVAHDPREPVDDDPANQCEAYRSGEADHFLELDPNGNFIRSG